MEYVETRTYTPDNFVAGMYPIATDTDHAAGEDGIKMYAPVILKDGKLYKLTAQASGGEETADETTTEDTGTEETTTEAAAVDTTGIYGIAMNDADTDEPVVVWCTGEFFGDALKLEDGVTLDSLILPMRNIGIFLKK